MKANRFNAMPLRNRHRIRRSKIEHIADQAMRQAVVDAGQGTVQRFVPRPAAQLGRVQDGILQRLDHFNGEKNEIHLSFR